MKLFKKEKYTNYKTNSKGLEKPVAQEMTVASPLFNKILIAVMTALLVIVMIAVI